MSTAAANISETDLCKLRHDVSVLVAEKHELSFLEERLVEIVSNK
jgi:hypothetical protein